MTEIIKPFQQARLIHELMSCPELGPNSEIWSSLNSNLSQEIADRLKEMGLSLEDFLTYKVRQFKKIIEVLKDKPALASVAASIMIASLAGCGFSEGGSSEASGAANKTAHLEAHEGVIPTIPAEGWGELENPIVDPILLLKKKLENNEISLNSELNYNVVFAAGAVAVNSLPAGTIPVQLEGGVAALLVPSTIEITGMISVLSFLTSSGLQTMVEGPGDIILEVGGKVRKIPLTPAQENLLRNPFSDTSKLLKVYFATGNADGNTLQAEIQGGNSGINDGDTDAERPEPTPDPNSQDSNQDSNTNKEQTEGKQGQEKPTLSDQELMDLLDEIFPVNAKSVTNFSFNNKKDGKRVENQEEYLKLLENIRMSIVPGYRKNLEDLAELLSRLDNPPDIIIGSGAYGVQNSLELAKQGITTVVVFEPATDSVYSNYEEIYVPTSSGELPSVSVIKIPARFDSTVQEIFEGAGVQFGRAWVPAPYPFTPDDITDKVDAYEWSQPFARMVSEGMVEEGIVISENPIYLEWLLSRYPNLTGGTLPEREPSPLSGGSFPGLWTNPSVYNLSFELQDSQ